jgi:hypothetical protein
MTKREGGGLERRSLVLWGAIVLCAASMSCSRARASRTLPLVEGTSVGKLQIDKATMADAAKTFGVSTDDATRDIGRGMVEMRTPLFQLTFVPTPDSQGPPRLYAARAELQEDVYTGKTSKGIGFLDSADAMRKAYGPPDAEWVAVFETIYFYQQGVIFTTQHPKKIPPALYAKARAATGKQPTEEPDAHVVTGIMVVRPFTVSKASAPMMAGQRVLSTRPETDLLVSPF